MVAPGTHVSNSAQPRLAAGGPQLVDLRHGKALGDQTLVVGLNEVSAPLLPFHDEALVTGSARLRAGAANLARRGLHYGGEWDLGRYIG